MIGHRRLRMEPLEHRTLLSATLLTDKLDYSPGETAVLSGSGFAAGEAVQLQVVHAPGTPGSNADAQNQPWQVAADATGSISTSWAVTDPDAVGSTYILSGIGLSSGETAQVTFTDSNSIIDEGSVKITSATYDNVALTLTVNFDYRLNYDAQSVTGSIHVVGVTTGFDFPKDCRPIQRATTPQRSSPL